MAEKEERIVLLVTKPKGECPCQIDKDYCKETCWVKGKCSLGMSRQEAIERIAKAIFNYYTDGIEPQNWKLKEVRDNFNKVAEAALNTLLSDGEKVK